MPKLNRMLGGFERKKMIVIGARPSNGKSAFAMQLAYDFSKKFKVLYLTLEMTVEEAIFRILCQHKKINNADMYNGNIPTDIVNDFYNIMDQEKRNLIIAQEIGKNWDEVNEVMELLQHDKPDIIFMDYIQCIKTSGKKMDAIEDYVKNLRAMAIEKNICVFVLSQINRTSISESVEPVMEGLKGTGVLEEQADKVILLHYPCKYGKDININQFKIIIDKNKNGSTGYMDCRIDPQWYYFSETLKEENYG